MICFTALTDHDVDDSNDGVGAARADSQQIRSVKTKHNQGSLLIEAKLASADICHLTDLSLLNDGRTLTEILIDAMHSQARDFFAYKPPM